MDNNHKSLLAISFSKGFESPNIPIVTIHQENTELNLIIDTGSDQNVIDNSILPQLKYEKDENKINLAGLGGTQIVERCTIPFTLEGQEYKAHFLISDLSDAFTSIRKCHAIPLHGMLGSIFLKENNIILDFNNMIAYNKN